MQHTALPDSTNLADPENRLVAGRIGTSVETRRCKRSRKSNCGSSRKRRESNIAPATREEFENLAGELEAVWNTPTAMLD